MIRRIFPVVFAVLLSSIGASTQGALVLSVSPVSPASLANDSPGQSIQLFARSDSGSAVSDIQAIQLFAYLGTGASGEIGIPAFEDFVWAPGVLASFVAPVQLPSTTPEVGFSNRSLEGVTDFVPASPAFTIETTPTLLGTYTVDTTGISDTTFIFGVGDTTPSGGGAASDVGLIGGGTEGFVAFSQSISVGASAVPEPGSMAFCGLVAAGMAFSKRRKKRGNQQNPALSV